MYIADEIEQELQGHQPLRRRSTRLPQLFRELLDLIGDAVVLRPVARRHHRSQGGSAETGFVQIGIVGIEFHVMPLRGCRSSLRALLAQGIGPDRLSGNVGLRPGIRFVCGENLGNLLFDRRIPGF
jgi:hypothetical protein